MRFREESEQGQYLGAEEEESDLWSEPSSRCSKKYEGLGISDFEERGFVRFE
jgi:hypothetical protein